MTKLDYKKDLKELYLPKAEPTLITIPPMNFIMVNGTGAPQDTGYQTAVGLLYALSYTIKMKGTPLPGYFDYAVFPLEGLWWTNTPVTNLDNRGSWLWTAMIRQPDFVTPEVFTWATELTQKKKPQLDFSRARLERFDEGPCVQMMHLGPYSDEPQTIERLHTFIKQQNLCVDTGPTRKHHEIYLSDPNKCAPQKLRTTLRLPVSKQ